MTEEDEYKQKEGQTQRFELFLKSIGKKQFEIANDIGLSAVTITAMKRRRMGVTVQTARIIEMIYGVREDWMLNGLGNMHAEKRHSDNYEYHKIDKQLLLQKIKLLEGKLKESESSEKIQKELVRLMEEKANIVKGDNDERQLPVC
jgi:plasmid maintenance system antidote protein VapI